MGFYLFTDEEKLELIERSILARLKGMMTNDARRDLAMLKAIALDYRARMPSRRSEAIELMERLLRHAERTRVNGTYEENALRHVGQQVIGLWPVMHAALIRIDRERNVDVGPAAQQNQAGESPK